MELAARRTALKASMDDVFRKLYVVNQTIDEILGSEQMTKLYKQRTDLKEKINQALGAYAEATKIQTTVEDRMRVEGKLDSVLSEAKKEESILEKIKKETAENLSKGRGK